jgi:diguanylate cyclase (GGDEF)-like protein
MGTGVGAKERLRRVVTVAWVLLPVAVVAFVWLHSLPGTLALGLAQCVFLIPIAVAAVVAERAYAVGEPGIERRAWGILSLTVFVLLISETYYSVYQVFVSPAGPSWPSPFDAFNALAAVMMAVAVIQLTGVGRLEVAGWLRLFFDAIAFSAVTFALLYHLTVEPFAGANPWWESVRWTAYSLIGVLIMVGVAWLLAHSRRGSERYMMTLVGSALTIFAAGMLLWPVWRFGSSDSSAGVVESLAAAVPLVGYYLLMLAALTRLRDRDAGWRVANGKLVSTEGVWASSLLSLYVFVGVGLIGAWEYFALNLQQDAQLQLACALIAILALVARTSVTAVETAVARSTADFDPVTGAMGAAAFVRRCDEALARAGRTGAALSLIVFDMDSFSDVNSVVGHAGGDAVLADVAALAARVAAGRGQVFRLSDDEFAVLCRANESLAVNLATELLGAIRGLRPVGDHALSASMGVAGCEAGTCTRDELVQHARAAKAWAKYRGKGRVIRFDARIVRALGVEERLRVHDDRSGPEMARALAAAADARDPRSYYHSRNVAALAVMLSEALELEPERIRRIEIAAMLHDVGKLVLSDALLADVLRTSRQQLAAREHAEFGEMLLQSVAMPGVPVWVRHHHERWDGAGYPDGLAGDALPLESRIIALADSYDAMTSGARTRTPMSRGAALQEIDLGMGSRFDPMLAEKFIEVVGQTASLGWSDEWASA